MIRMRALSLFVVLAFVSVLGAVSVTAHGASPSAGLPDRDTSLLRGLGLPEITLVVTDADVTEMPSDLAAGRYLVSVDNQTADQNIGVVMLAVPAGTTDEDALDGILGEGLPAWFYEATWAGGPIAAPGQTDAVVVELAAGDWWIDIDRTADAATQPVDTASKVQVTGELLAGGEVPSAVSIDLTEYSFAMPDTLTAGPQIWQLTNAGEQPHLLDLEWLPGGTTFDQVMELLSFAFTG